MKIEQGHPIHVDTGLVATAQGKGLAPGKRRRKRIALTLCHCSSIKTDGIKPGDFVRNHSITKDCDLREI